MISIIENLAKHAVDLACDLQQIPSPTFHEERKAEVIRQRFQTFGLEEVKRTVNTPGGHSWMNYGDASAVHELTSLGYPSITIGLTTGDHAHTSNEYINTAVIGKGMTQLLRIIERIWD